MRSSAVVSFLIPALLWAQNWQAALPGYRFAFPRDHFSHANYQTEWWYYTGNLHSSDGHRYGFELTFFRQGARLSADAAESEDATWRPDQLYLAHLALSDLDGHSFYHAERLNRAGPGLAGMDFSDARYWNGNWEVRWPGLLRNPPRTGPVQDVHFTLRTAKQQLAAVCGRFALHLTLEPVKMPIVQ